MTTGSMAGLFPVVGALTYSCTKSFVEFLATGLNYELKDRIDVMNYSSGFVRTNMNPFSPDDFHTCTPQKAVKSSIAEIGYEHTTWGPFCHES
jgi:short-subunit dehydrogenase